MSKYFKEMILTAPVHNITKKYPSSFVLKDYKQLYILTNYYVLVYANAFP